MKLLALALLCSAPVLAQTLVHTPATLASAAAEAKAGTTHASGISYVARLSDRSTPYSRLGADNARWDLLLARHQYDLQLLAEKTSTALQIGVVSGVYVKADGTKVSFAGGTLSIPDASTGRKVYIDVASNALAQGSSWPATETDYLPICEVDTSGGAVTAVYDRRGYTAQRITPSFTDLGQTSAAAFVLDYDNAGAEVTQQIRFNRGSTDGEDAALEWDASNDRFNARKQHSTATLAPLNAASFLAGGTEVVDSSARLTATSATAATFTFDADNAGGGADQQLRFNRGSTDGEDAALEWDEANDRFDFLTQHSTATLSTVNVGSLRVAGTEVFTSGAKLATTALADALADKLAQLSIGDASGASPRTVTIQAQDIQGNNLSEVVYLQIGVYQDADGAATATNATIAIGGTGSLVRSVTANKVLVIKTNSSGTATVTITDGTLETIYLLAEPSTRSKLLDCSDIGTVVIS